MVWRVRLLPATGKETAGQRKSGSGIKIGVEGVAGDSPAVLERGKQKRRRRKLKLWSKERKVVFVITFLEGILVEALPTQVVINVQGVGYQVLIPLSSYDRLPPVGASFRLLTHLVVREDAHLLYGFATKEERDLFRLLIHHVSGVGPKMGLSVLSGMSVVMFQAAVVRNDIASLSKISGVGKKTAERIVVELKDKVGVAAEWEAASAKNAPSEEDAVSHDAVLALMALGYKQVEAHKAVKAAAAHLQGRLTSEELIRNALKLLA